VLVVDNWLKPGGLRPIRAVALPKSEVLHELVGSRHCGHLNTSTTSGHDISPVGLDFLGIVLALQLRLDLEARSL
jgi:hypothetical protein